MRAIKNLAHALAVTTIFCAGIGGAVLLVQQVEAHGIAYVAGRFLSTRAPTIHAFMDRAIQPELINLLRTFKRGDRIRLLAYALTDQVFAQTLIEKWHEGVDVEIVADTSGITHEASRLIALAHHIPISCSPSPHEKHEDKAKLQHNKCLVGRRNSVPIVVTGSYNFTRSAATRHHENMLIIIGDHALALQYETYFEKIKSQAVPIHEILPKKPERPLKKLDAEMAKLIKGVAR